MPRERIGPAARAGAHAALLDAALAYARLCWAVFPCHWYGHHRKHPLTPHGFRDASTDPAVIRAWWTRWPDALIGMPTERASGLWVLEIGEQERTLNAEVFSIDTLAGAGLVPADIALRALLRPSNAIPDRDPGWPWCTEEIDFKVRRAFNAGQAQPREVCCAVA